MSSDGGLNICFNEKKNSTIIIKYRLVARVLNYKAHVSVLKRHILLQNLQRKRLYK